jgi:hypothetical protein
MKIIKKMIRTFNDWCDQADNHHHFHKLWSSAVGMPGYNKADWIKVQEQLIKNNII